ncbi:MAG: hypothetical protein ACRDPM_16705 [Solirubrobacteraceae bacterium]
MSVSVDGVVATPKDAGALDSVGEDQALKQLKLEWRGDVGTHIMGRTTYEKMASHWPYSGSIDLHLARAQAFANGAVLHVYDGARGRSAG